MKSAVAVLIVLLLASSGFWLYRLLYARVGLSYRERQAYELEETRQQLVVLLREIAQGATKQQIVGAAGRCTIQTASEKDGCIWVGWVGCKFPGNERLESVSPAWSYGGDDRCYLPLQQFNQLRARGARRGRAAPGNSRVARLRPGAQPDIRPRRRS